MDKCKPSTSGNFQMAKQMNRWPKITFFCSLVLGLAMTAILIQYAGWKNIAAVISQASLLDLLLALGVYAGSWFWRARRFLSFAKRSNSRITSWQLFKMNISGFALNNLLPAHMGDIATAVYLKMTGIPGGKSTAMVLQTRLLDLLTLIFLCLLLLPFAVVKEAPAWIWRTIFIGILFVFCPYIIAWSEKSHRLSTYLTVLQNKTSWPPGRYLWAKIYSIYLGFTEIIIDKKLFLSTFFFSLLIWLGEGITCYIIACSLHVHLPLSLAILSVSLANIGKAVPATPGGIGVYEGIMMSMLLWGGYSAEIALAIALLDHLSKKCFTVSIGLSATYHLIGARWYERLTKVEKREKNQC